MVRVLSNCEKNSDNVDVVGCLEEFCYRLNLSGYPVALAGRILRSGILTYEKRLRRELDGGSRIHRPETEGMGRRE